LTDGLPNILTTIPTVALRETDLPDTIKSELSKEIPDKKKINEWLKKTFTQTTGTSVTDKAAFRTWLCYQEEHSDTSIFYRNYPKLQQVTCVDLSSKINSLKQRYCSHCNPTNSKQDGFPIFNFVLRLRGRSRQSITAAEFAAYQLAVRQHLTKHQASFRNFDHYCLALTFILNRSNKDRDVDNMSKTMMDALPRALGFDDAKITHLDALKIHISCAEEVVYLRLAPSYLDTYYHDDVAINELHHFFAVGPRLV
jgi:Holliday junction resolvase RusA-like endonuclease